MNSLLSPQRDTNSPVDCLRGCGRIRARLPHRALWTVPRQNSPRKNSQRANQQSHSRIFLRQYCTILSADTASEARQLLSQNAVPQPPERCLSRQAGIVRCCLKDFPPPFYKNLPRAFSALGSEVFISPSISFHPDFIWVCLIQSFQSKPYIQALLPNHCQ